MPFAVGGAGAGVFMDRATLLGGVALLLWASLALLSRAASSVPPFQLAAMSFAMSGGIGLAWLGLTRNLGALRVSPLAWAHGVGGLFLYHALFFAALALAPAAEANLLNYAWPLLIVLLSAPLLGLHLTWRHVAGVLAGLTGCFLLLAGGASFKGAAITGYFCAFAAAWIWALYSVLARRMRAVPTKAVIGFCAATALLAALAHFAVETTICPGWRALLAITALGLGPVGAAFLLWDHGMKQGDPRLLAALAYAVPVASTLLLALGGYATLSPKILAAALLVTLGGTLAATAPRHPSAHQPNRNHHPTPK